MGCVNSSEFIEISFAKNRTQTKDYGHETLSEKFTAVERRKYVRPVVSAPKILVTFKDNKSDLSASIIRGFKSKSKDNVIVEVFLELSETPLEMIPIISLGESSIPSSFKTNCFNESESSRFDSDKNVSVNKLNEKLHVKEKSDEVSSEKNVEGKLDQHKSPEMIPLEDIVLPRKGSLNNGIINPPTIEGYITNVLRRNSLEGYFYDFYDLIYVSC
jgi:hypothetical protein